MDNLVKVGNPIYQSDGKIDALDEAYQRFMVIIDEYVNHKKPDFSAEEMNTITELINEYYIQKRASYFFEIKTKAISERINSSFLDAFRQVNELDDKHHTTKVIYYNNKRHQLINNE